MSGNLAINPDHLLALRLVLPADKYSNGSKLLSFSDKLVARMQRPPGVQSAATAAFLPLSGWWGSRTVTRSTATEANPAASM